MVDASMRIHACVFGYDSGLDMIRSLGGNNALYSSEIWGDMMRDGDDTMAQQQGFSVTQTLVGTNISPMSNVGGTHAPHITRHTGSLGVAT